MDPKIWALIGGAIVQVGNIGVALLTGSREKQADRRAHRRADDERKVAVYPALLLAGAEATRILGGHSSPRAAWERDEYEATWQEFREQASTAIVIGNAGVREAVDAYEKALSAGQMSLNDRRIKVAEARQALIAAMDKDRGRR